MVVHTQTSACTTPSARWSSSCSSTTRSTARLRQGRRVPAAGHHLRLGPRHLALHRAQAPLQEAARALAADRDRPRALHPLLPLRALLAGDRRGLPADPAERGAHSYVSPSTATRTWRRSPATSSSCAPWARSPRAVPLPRAPVGHRGRRHRLHDVPAQCNVELTVRDDRVLRVSRATRGGRRRLAVRQGPLSPTSTCTPTSASVAAMREGTAARAWKGATAPAAPGARKAGRRPALAAARRPTRRLSSRAVPQGLIRPPRARPPARPARRAGARLADPALQARPTSSSPTRC
jgi:hypothetical protein